MKQVRYEDPCSDCQLNCRPIAASGSKKAKYLVVCKHTNTRAINTKRHMSDSAMRVFAKHIQDAGLHKSDFVFTNTIKCNYDPAEYPVKDRHSIESRCREYLLRLIETMQPEIIIPLGAEAATAVEGRKVKITKARGLPYYNEKHDAFVLPMMDPGYVHFNPQHEGLFASDCKSLGRFLDNDMDIEASGTVLDGEYKKVKDIQFLIDEKPEFVSFDLETVGKRWQDRSKSIVTIHLCTEAGRAYMVPWDHPDDPLSLREKAKIKRQLKTLLQDPEVSVIGQNNKFDALWILDRLGFRYRIDHDTLMMAATIDENLQNKDQDTLVKLYVPEMAGYADAFNQNYDKSRMDLVPLVNILDYGCGDVDSCLRLFFRLEQDLRKDRKLWNHYRRVSMPAINAFVPIEHVGMRVDEEALDEFEEVLSEHVEQLKDDIFSMIHREVKRKFFRLGKLKLSSGMFLRDVLYHHECGFNLTPVAFTKTSAKLADEYKVPSTSSKDALPYYFDHPEAGDFCIKLAEWIKLNRLLGTNVRKFRENYIMDGKIHPIYSLWVAVTGRTASRDPNGQNFPKRGSMAKKYRKIFVPPPGHVILEADLSQAELRIAADMSCDPTMLRIYRENGDIHKHTATIVMGVTMAEFEQLPDEEKSLARFKAKAVNFGFLYGMGWRKFIVYAKTQYGVEFTEQESRRIRDGFFDTYWALPAWHQKMREFAQEYGYVRSYSGRVRHLPMIESEDEGIAAEAGRQAINSPVQNFGSDLGVMAISRITQEIDPNYMCVMGFVHDAIYAYVPEEYLEWGAKTMKYYMETNPLDEWFGREMQLPIVADVGFGWNGGETYEMSGLTLIDPYDFEPLAWDNEKEEYAFELPYQRIPPNEGRVEIAEYLVV